MSAGQRHRYRRADRIVTGCASVISTGGRGLQGGQGDARLRALRAQGRRDGERVVAGLRIYVKNLSNPLISPSIKNVDREKKS